MHRQRTALDGTRPDVQIKRDTSRSARLTAEMRLRREAAALDEQAATILRTMAIMQAEAMMLMARAAVLRRDTQEAEKL